MTEIAHTAEIEMRALAEAAFAVVAKDILTAEDDPAHSPDTGRSTSAP